MPVGVAQRIKMLIDILLRNDTLSCYAIFVRHCLTIYNVDISLTACYLSSCDVKSGKMTKFKKSNLIQSKPKKKGKKGCCALIHICSQVF